MGAVLVASAARNVIEYFFAILPFVLHTRHCYFPTPDEIDFIISSAEAG
jgi:wobble nucleotide-excising tRNase